MEHVILVAFEVNAGTPEDAQKQLMSHLPKTESHVQAVGWPIVAWWIAEDERHDGSDLQSAVFTQGLEQEKATELLTRVVDANPHLRTGRC